MALWVHVFHLEITAVDLVAERRLARLRQAEKRVGEGSNVRERTVSDRPGEGVIRAAALGFSTMEAKSRCPL